MRTMKPEHERALEIGERLGEMDEAHQLLKDWRNLEFCSDDANEMPHEYHARHARLDEKTREFLARPDARQLALQRLAEVLLDCAKWIEGPRKECIAETQMDLLNKAHAALAAAKPYLEKP